jgi:nicotinamidase/pyrazinamidase
LASLLHRIERSKVGNQKSPEEEFMLTEINNQDALILVDVQRDFCRGGALPVPEGDAVVPILNRWIQAAEQAGAAIYASRDYHPPGHVSFRGSGGRWPPHCVQNTRGTEFHPELRLPASTRVVTKGTLTHRDQYSAFDETGLAEELRSRGVRRIWIGGLAQDVCVRATVLDGLVEGFEVYLIREGTRPVEPDAEPVILAELQEAGATVEMAA